MCRLCTTEAARGLLPSLKGSPRLINIFDPCVFVTWDTVFTCSGARFPTAREYRDTLPNAYLRSPEGQHIVDVVNGLKNAGIIAGYGQSKRQGFT